MNVRATLEIPIFPLGTVLYPEGLLPLRIFEQRYLDMTKICIRDDAPFGVCLIREGTEAGAPAVPYAIGCTDVCYAGWWKQYKAPKAVFPYTE